MLAERRRRRINARATVRKRKSRERDAETAIDPVAASVVMDDSSARKLWIGHGLAHRTHACRRHVPCLQEVFPFVRGAREHDLAQHLGLALSVSLPLFIGLLDQVRTFKQRPQAALLSE